MPCQHCLRHWLNQRLVWQSATRLVQTCDRYRCGKRSLYGTSEGSSRQRTRRYREPAVRNLQQYIRHYDIRVLLFAHHLQEEQDNGKSDAVLCHDWHDISGDARSKNGYYDDHIFDDCRLHGFQEIPFSHRQQNR